MLTPRANWLDRAIAVAAPRAARKRVQARAAFENAVATRGYEGAARGRHTANWKAPATSADTEIGRDLSLLRARHRDLVRNNPHARKARWVWTSNLVHDGILPTAVSNDDALNKAVTDLYKDWVKVADADGQLDFYGLQELAVGGMIEGAETLIRRRLRKPEDGLKVPLQLEVLEGDHLDHTVNGPQLNGRKAVQGVEFDAINRRTAYWLYPEHPGNAWVGMGSQLLSRPVPASEVLHLYRKERKQTRGVPWGHAIIVSVRDIGDYDFAERVRKKTESCIVGVVLGAEDGDEIAPASATLKDADGNPVTQMEPGLFVYAQGGKDVKFNTPSSAGGYADFKRVSLHDVAAGFLVPYELLTGDLSLVNFSSARVGLVEFRRLVKTIQWLTIVPMFLDPVWAWFCEAAYLAGEIKVPYVPVRWEPPAFESVNPIDDANSDLIEMRSGTKTLFEKIAAKGRDPEEALREHKRGFDLLDELGLVFDSDPRRVSRGGQEQPSRQAEEAGQRGQESRRFPRLTSITR